MQLVQSAGFEAENLFECRAFLQRAIRFVSHVGGLDNQEPGVGVVDNIADLLRRIRVVDGGEHAAARHHSGVENIPFI